jgi:hypothetical protein
MSDFVIRPRIHVAMWNEDDAAFEPLGAFDFEMFWTIPAVGDVLVNLIEAGGPVTVIDRHYFSSPVDEQHWWWLVVGEVTDKAEQAAMESLDKEVRQAYAVIRAERSDEATALLSQSARRSRPGTRLRRR